MRFMSDFREAMWGVVQQGISELDFDFVAYATEHFDRLLRTARRAVDPALSLEALGVKTKARARSSSAEASAAARSSTG